MILDNHTISPVYHPSSCILPATLDPSLHWQQPQMEHTNHPPDSHVDQVHAQLYETSGAGKDSIDDEPTSSTYNESSMVSPNDI